MMEGLEEEGGADAVGATVSRSEEVAGAGGGAGAGTGAGDGASSCNLMSLNCNKAGMAGLDKEKINQIIEQASRGSKFYAKGQSRFYFIQLNMFTLIII